MEDISRLFVMPDTLLHEVIVCINNSQSGIALVVDEERRLLGVVTDGDIRRLVLKELDLAIPIRQVLDQEAAKFPPVTADYRTSREDIFNLLRQTRLSHIPLLNEDERVVDLIALDDFVPGNALPVQAMVLAGGFGSRLQPLTNSLPKPMLPLGERPLLEHIIQQLSEVGIHRVNVATHYLAEKIVDHFGDGSGFGVNLNYVSEERPLGTAGALGLIDEIEEPLLVLNGDIFTKINYRAMLVYHQEHQADLTMAVRKYEFKVPYGVVESDGQSVTGLREKPLMSFFVNAGIYLLQPSASRFIKHGENIDMTDLIQRLLDAGRNVISFPVLEYWIDIGQLADYERAQEDVKEGRV
jgi:dTDP-glucose pyrophosphorylase/CBS domain-containing protein